MAKTPKTSEAGDALDNPAPAEKIEVTAAMSDEERAEALAHNAKVEEAEGAAHIGEILENRRKRFAQE